MSQPNTSAIETMLQGATPVTSEKAPSAAAAETAPPAAAAEKAMMDAEGYAEEGLAEHKASNANAHS